MFVSTVSAEVEVSWSDCWQMFLIESGMAALEEPGSPQHEGGNALKTFFMQHAKLQMAWYDKLMEHEIDYDDLMESTENLLREMLKDCNLKTGAILKIINAIRQNPNSQIHIDSKEVKVSVISMEESMATSNMTQKIADIDEAMEAVEKMKQSLYVNSEVYKNEIDDCFDAIIQSANRRRRELLTQLNCIADAKHTELSNQRDHLSKEREKLHICLIKSQNMIKDISMDPKERKMKIVSVSEQILKNKVDLRLITNDEINVEIDIEEITLRISMIGRVHNLDSFYKLVCDDDENDNFDDECKTEEVGIDENKLSAGLPTRSPGRGSIYRHISPSLQQFISHIPDDNIDNSNCRKRRGRGGRRGRVRRRGDKCRRSTG